MKLDMSNQEVYNQAKHAVEDILLGQDDSGTTLLQRELTNAFFTSIGKWLVGGGMVIIIGIAGIYYQVGNNTQQINEGGRYTQEEHDAYANTIDRRFDDFGDDIDEIKDDVRAIRQSLKN